MAHRKEKLLRVTTEYFSAVAVWEKIWGIWTCVQADRVIRWMKGMDAGNAKTALLQMDAKLEWTDLS